jgi:hypothetical protein
MSYALGQPGELAWVSIFNSLENRAATGKFRPALLVARDGGTWATMGLTTNPTYRDGTPRIAIPNPTVVGLRGPGFLWGDRLTPVSPIDVGDHIGWADAALVEAVICLAALDGAWAAGLRGSVAAADVSASR